MRHQTSLESVPGAGPPSSGCHVPEEMEVEVELEVELRILKKPQPQTERLCDAVCAQDKR